MVTYYNAFFDLFFTVENFDLDKLAAEGILVDLGSDDQYQRRYSLSFPDGYQDESGYSIEGTFNIQSTLAEDIAGNETNFEFENFVFNGLLVEGTKSINIGENSTETVMNAAWCPGEEGIAITLSNGQVVIFFGCLEKVVNEGLMVVNGTSSISINDEKIEVEISKELVKEKDCFWFTDGELRIHSQNKAVLNFTTTCDHPKMIISDVTSCSSETISQIHDLW